MKRLLFIALLVLAFSSTAFAQKGRVQILAQTGGACGTTNAQQHCTVLTWGASPTTGVTYNVYRGTATGAESSVPLNTNPITTLTYTDLVTLTTSQQQFFYYVEAVEAGTSVGTVFSVPSNEVSATFPALPQAPPNLVEQTH